MNIGGIPNLEDEYREQGKEIITFRDKEIVYYNSEYVDWLKDRIYELEHFKRKHTKFTITKEQYQKMITPNPEAMKKRDEMFKRIQETIKITDLPDGIRKIEFLDVDK